MRSFGFHFCFLVLKSQQQIFCPLHIKSITNGALGNRVSFQEYENYRISPYGQTNTLIEKKQHEYVYNRMCIEFQFILLNELNTLSDFVPFDVTNENE